MERDGYPTYTTSAGWLGYPDDKLRRLCRELTARGWQHFKIKVGRNLEDDIRRCRIIREEIGWDRRLMTDANQVWGVNEAITWMKQLAEFKPYFIEEPTSPRRRAGARHHRPGHRPHQGGHRRDVPEPGDVQAADAGRGHRLLPDRQLPPGRGQRDPVGAADGREVRRPGVAARRRRGAVRVRPAPVDHRLRLRQRLDRGSADRVRRPPARALRRSAGDQERPLHAAQGARLQHHHETAKPWTSSPFRADVPGAES